jgi:hypothetical protein
MIDRRALVAALAGAGAGAGGSAAALLDTGTDDALLRPVRAFLDAGVRGEVASLGEEGVDAPRLTVGRPWAVRGAAFPKLAPQSAALSPGSYLLRRRSGRVDVLVSLASGDEAICRFELSSVAGEPRVTAVELAPADWVPLVRSIEPGRPNEDASLRVQQAYDALAASGGGTLYFPPGDYRINLRMHARTVQLLGAGAGATRLRPAVGARPVLQALYTSGQWDTVRIEGLGLLGTGAGPGLLCGHERHVTGDEFAGRTALRGVRFERFTAAIVRPSGQIGLWLDQCQFEAADYHLLCRDHPGPGEPMHAGCMVARSCHFQGASTAVARIVGQVTGAGQILFEECIFESNPGCVLILDALNNTDATPALTLRSCWNENNGTAATVSFEGRRFAPVFGALTDTGPIRAEDTPVGSVTLLRSTLMTRHCPLDRFAIVSRDAASTVVHEHARGFGSFQPAGRVLSVAAAYQFLPNRALFFPMPPRRRGTVTQAGAASLAVAQARGPLVVVGNGGVATLADRRWRPAAMGAVRLAEEGSVGPESWLAWLFQYRANGEGAPRLELTGGYGVGSAVLDQADETALAGMTLLPAGARSLGFYLSAPAGSTAVIDIGPVNLVRFATRQAALDFVNANHWLERE